MSDCTSNGSDESGVVTSLGGTTPDFYVPSNALYKASFGITYNFPRTKYWSFRTSCEQKLILGAVFRKVCNQVDVKRVKTYKMIFEFCKDGNVHLHGIINVRANHKGDLPSSVGFVLDYAKIFYRVTRSLKLIHQQFNEKRYNSTFCKFTSPPLCIKYLNKDDAIVYEEYMMKDIKNNNLNN